MVTSPQEGILHERLVIDTRKALLQQPKLGVSWENILIEQTLARVHTNEATSRQRIRALKSICLLTMQTYSLV